MKDFHQQLLRLIRANKLLAWATVIRSSGSTPQKPGSAAIFDATGLLAGTIGGGIMEAEVEKSVRTLLKTKESDVVRFILDREQGGEEAICGGEAEVLIDAHPALHREALEALEAALSQKEEGRLITVVGRKKERARKINRYWITGGSATSLSPQLPERIARILVENPPGDKGESWHLKKIQESDHPDVEFVITEWIRPLPQLIIAGAGHIGKALAHLGNLLDFEVTVIDDRAEYANAKNLPDAEHIVVKDIGEAVRLLNPGPDTYCVIVTRGHHQDGEALKPLIGSEAAYIGMIGSRHKVGIMKKEFLSKGWATPAQWDRIFAPIGLSIGSKTVQEIALSIAAQLVQVRNKNRLRYGS